MTNRDEHRRPASGTAADGVRKLDVLGIPVAVLDYQGAMDVMDTLVSERQRGYVCAIAVHALMVAQEDREMHAALLGSTLVLPDGMPIVWALNWLGADLPDRVYGPELMWRYNERCAKQGHRLWLYGGHDEGWLAKLAASLRQRHPRLEIVGGCTAPFRALTVDEEDAIVERINRARPDVLWVGTGAPNQEKWMARIRGRLDVPVMCGVGAAFDFHAGRVSQAPGWMQKRGLEWVYRLVQEPRRLFPRYAYYNPRFLWAFTGQLVRGRRRARA